MATNTAAASSRPRLLQMAVLAAAGCVAAAPGANAAAMFYWQDSDPSYYRSIPEVQPRKPKPRPAAKVQKAIKETSAKPQGPLIVTVSIEQQWLRLYDANGLFAESPVSTGMKGHSTPMGVFSVIQKNKMHRSNIYSGAPMPYMQRITWSGIALHAGVLPGYPASHGCIRMPNAFAVKMWNWTRMGARVIIAPGQISPASITHPLLAAQKVVPQPLIANDPANDAPAVKGDKGADAGGATPALELRSTVGHAPMRGQTQTADASGASPATSPAVTMTDATPAAATIPPAVEANSEAPTAAIEKAAPAKADPANAEETKPSETKIEKPGEPVKAQGAPPEAVKKDTARPPGAEKPAVRRPGQIAVFVSRKDSMLYVRENFKAQYEVPVTIAPGDRPLGTHVFTAATDKSDSNLLRWSALSMPVLARPAVRIDEDPAKRRKAGATPAEARPAPLPNSAAEALDRITVPPEAMARIAEVLSTGGSIIVSDLGINQGGETGEGTEFIIPLR
ncbi:MAG: L,D-transpeptidase family protein [Bradyrhizobium sp.]